MEKTSSSLMFCSKKFKEKLPSESDKTPTFLLINFTSENGIPFLNHNLKLRHQY